MSVDLSVLLVVRDWSTQRLALSLDSLLAARQKLRAEVILLDYGSEDPEPYKTLAKEFDVVYIRAEASVWSRSRAVNVAAAAAKGDWLLFADADMLWSPRSLSRSLELVSQDSNQYLVFQARDLPQEYNGAALAARGYDWDDLEHQASWRPRWGMGMQLLSAAKFRQVQGLDERMTVWGAEDNDMARRLQAVGLKQHWVNEPDVRVYHVWHEYSWHAASLDPEAAAAVKRNKEILRQDRSVMRNLPTWENRPPSADPLVSVVIVTRDRVAYLKDAIDSVLAQTFQDFEVIIIDDGTTDEVEELILGYGDERLRRFKSRSRGVAAGRNQGAEVTRGFYTAVHDDDDIMLPWSLETRLKAIQRGEVGSYGGFWNFANDSGNLELVPGKEWSLQAIYSGKTAGHPTILLETEVIRRIGYDESIEAGSDYKFRVQSALAGYKMRHCGDVVTLRRMHPHNMSVVDVGTQRNTSDLVNAAVRFNTPGTERKALRTQTRDQDVPVVEMAPTRASPQRVMPWLPNHLVTRVGVVRLAGSEIDITSEGLQLYATVISNGRKDRYVLLPDPTAQEIAQLSDRFAESGNFSLQAFPSVDADDNAQFAFLMSGLAMTHEQWLTSEGSEIVAYSVSGDLENGTVLQAHSATELSSLFKKAGDLDLIYSPRHGESSLAQLLAESTV